MSRACRKWLENQTIAVAHTTVTTHDSTACTHHKISILLLHELILILLIELLQGNLSIQDFDRRGKDLNWSSLALQVTTCTSSLGTRFFRGSGSETTPPPIQRCTVHVQCLLSVLDPRYCDSRSQGYIMMAAQQQPAVHVADFSDIWLSQPAALHHRRGSSIRLSENNTVAERVESWGYPSNGVVMTAEPVSVGTMFQVTVLETVKTWSGSLVSVFMGLAEDHLSLVQK